MSSRVASASVGQGRAQTVPVTRTGMQAESSKTIPAFTASKQWTRMNHVMSKLKYKGTREKESEDRSNRDTKKRNRLMSLMSDIAWKHSLVVCSTARARPRKGRECDMAARGIIRP